MNKYKIELTENQLRLISYACEKLSRLIVGQVKTAIENELDVALLRHVSDNKLNDKYWETRSTIHDILDNLHLICWNQPVNTHYGVNYSEKSDTLFDIYEVIRHELWKNDPDTNKSEYINDAYPAFHWNKNEPLIDIKKLKDE